MTNFSFRSFLSQLSLRTRLWTSVFWSAPIFLDQYFLPRERSHHYNNELWEDIFDAVYITYRYENDFAKMIHNFKYLGQRDIMWSFSPGIDYILSKYLVNHRGEDILLSYVPFGWYQIFTRPYNHSRLIAEYIYSKLSSSWNKVPKLKNLLWKRKITEHQAHLSKDWRILNTRDAFMLAPWVNPDTIKGRTVCLVDDVISSGSTLQSIAHIFRSHWAQKIIVIVLASTLV